MNPWAVGAIVGEYRLVEPLGAGGMGEVWRVVHQPTGAERALKVCLADDPEASTRFQREARAMAELEHPNVCRVHTAGAHAGRLYLVLDLALGGDLEARLKHGPLDPELARELIGALARGLSHVHAHGLLHRDLKPSNVLFDDQGQPLLVDFGLVRRVDGSSLTQSGAIVGTPSYMAPEQANPVVDADERTDVYGLGALLYHMLTGAPPFGGPSMIATLTAVMEEPPTPPWRLNPAAPRDLSQICLKALAKSPGARHPSAQTFAAALESGGLRRRRGALPLAVGTLAFVSMGVAGFLAASWPKQPATPRPTPAPRVVNPPPTVPENLNPPLPPSEAMERTLGALAPPVESDVSALEHDIVRYHLAKLLVYETGTGLVTAANWLWKRGDRARCLAWLYHGALHGTDRESKRCWDRLAHFLIQEPLDAVGWPEALWIQEGGAVLIECHTRAAKAHHSDAWLHLANLHRLGNTRLGVAIDPPEALRCYREILLLAEEQPALCELEDRVSAGLGIARLVLESPDLLGAGSDRQALEILDPLLSGVEPGSFRLRDGVLLRRSLQYRSDRVGAGRPDLEFDRAMAHLRLPEASDLRGCQDAVVHQFLEAILDGTTSFGALRATAYLWQERKHEKAFALTYRLGMCTDDSEGQGAWTRLASYLAKPEAEATFDRTNEAWNAIQGPYVLECFRRSIAAGLAEGHFGLAEVYKDPGELGIEPDLTLAAEQFRLVVTAKHGDANWRNHARLQLARLCMERKGEPGCPSFEESVAALEEVLKPDHSQSRHRPAAVALLPRLKATYGSNGD